MQSKRIDAFAAHPGTAKTAIWDKTDKNKVEGVAFDLTAKVSSVIYQCKPFIMSHAPLASQQALSLWPSCALNAQTWDCCMT